MAISKKDFLLGALFGPAILRFLFIVFLTIIILVFGTTSSPSPSSHPSSQIKTAVTHPAVGPHSGTFRASDVTTTQVPQPSEDITSETVRTPDGMSFMKRN